MIRVERESDVVYVSVSQVDGVITMANKMQNNGKLGHYQIRERTKVSGEGVTAGGVPVSWWWLNE